MELRPARLGNRGATLAILAAYTLVFWVLLPAALWRAGLEVDRRAGWQRAPSALGWPVLAAALALMALGARELWLRGRGLPVSALPPPRFARWGVYARMRHPIYVGFDVAVLGAGLVLGSRGLAFVVAPAFLPVWMAYALVEERALAARFGSVYRRYRRKVGLLPRPGLYRLTRALVSLRVFPTRVEGRQHVPRRGAAVLVANHACYLDPVYLGAVTWRTVHYLTTAEAYRGALSRWLMHSFVNVPVRRYRQDPAACRELLRLLAEGELVGLFVEGERSPLGDYQGAEPGVASILARLPAPVIPVGISGSYDSGPRWADRLRRREVRLRVGAPLRFEAEAPATVVDRAIRGLLDADPQPVRLSGLPRHRLARVLWRCPCCGDEPAWAAERLACGSCGASYGSTADGWLRERGGSCRSLGDLGRNVRALPESLPLRVPATALRERSSFGPIRRLEPVADGELVIGPGGLRLGSLEVRAAEVRSVSTERADTLQVGTCDGMVQFRLGGGSAFRLHAAVRRVSAAARPGDRTPRRRAEGRR